MPLALHLAFAFALVVFGYLGLFSIGAPFLLTGVGMLAITPWRRDRDVLIPTLIGPWIATATYVLFGPLGCTTSGTTPTTGQAFATTSCENVLGLDYRGGAGYRPPSEIVMLAGLTVGLVASIALGMLLRRRAARR